MSTAQSTTEIDNECLRVTRWTFAAQGDNTGAHVHDYDYIVVPVTGGTFTVTDPDGAARELAQHAAHDVANHTSASATFIACCSWHPNQRPPGLRQGTPTTRTAGLTASSGLCAPAGSAPSSSCCWVSPPAPASST